MRTPEDYENIKGGIVVDYEGLVKMNVALRNCYALARKRTTQEPKRDDWKEIVRWCEEAGLKPSLLREEVRVMAYKQLTFKDHEDGSTAWYGGEFVGTILKSECGWDVYSVTTDYTHDDLPTRDAAKQSITRGWVASGYKTDPTILMDSNLRETA